MAGGSLTITVPSYAALQTVLQRVTCWAGGVAGYNNQRRITVLSTTGTPSVYIPEELFSIGALVLEVGGSDLLSGYVAGTNITYNANNGTATYINPNTCAASPALPTIGAVTMNVGGNPAVVNMAWVNTANGTVDVNWGDGVIQTGQTESSNLNHTYVRGNTYTVRVSDNSAPATYAETQIYVP